MSNVATLPSPAQHATALDILASPDAFAHMQRVAKVFCASALIPAHLRGNNGADALLALAIAKRMGEDPVMVMQNIYVVHGRAGWSAQYMIARANRSGVFKGPISWRESGKGDDYAVTAFAKVAETGEEISFTVSMATAKAEGWTQNKKYQTLGPLMLRYRSATLLIRLYCPEVMMGMPGADELEDIAPPAGMRDVTPAADVTAALTGATIEEPASPATPADDASVGADAASHPATQPTEESTPEPSVPPSEPAADYDPDPPWDAERCRTVGRAIIGDLMKAKTIKAVDNIIATRGVDLAEIKRASEQAYDHIMTQSAGRKEFLATNAA